MREFEGAQSALGNDRERGRL
ncbi:hypothetical protein MPNT_160050 [Candidatus Methylacidithermus pantelleriae]|uniref:Uncharacterized protein n=1 Tax=Candidatus Methylacidithermus pantelleriae TaxID=2744239 RepID=A0A8J2BJY8_9BACT|nr:hypothetical protein MPNT_160050 [Candidatus Methylacidithermus pantelleriae]